MGNLQHPGRKGLLGLQQLWGYWASVWDGRMLWFVSYWLLILGCGLPWDWSGGMGQDKTCICTPCIHLLLVYGLGCWGICRIGVGCVWAIGFLCSTNRHLYELTQVFSRSRRNVAGATRLQIKLGPVEVFLTIKHERHTLIRVDR